MTTFVSGKTDEFGGVAGLPGDKSVSIRALILGSLAQGKSRISGLPASDDVASCAGALKALGVSIYKEGDVTVVEGVGGNGFQAPDGDLDFGNSGTASRLLMGVLAGQDIEVRITGDASLKTRPFGRIATPLSEMGADFSGGTLPLILKGTSDLKPITYVLPVASAQVKSAVLLAGLNTKGTTGVIEKTQTRDHTERMLEGFGVPVQKTETGDGTLITLDGPATLQAQSFTIPGDISASAFLLAAGLLKGTSGLTLENVGVNPTRHAILSALQKMGADITLANQKNDSGEPVADIFLKGGPISGIHTKPEDAPLLIDEFPILFALAAFADGPSIFEGLAELRKKESDRLSVMAEGLAANGVEVEEGEDILTITPGAVKGGATIDAHHDHRIAMSFLVLGMAAENPVTVTGAETISTSFPGFAKVMNGLGANIEEVK